MSYFGRFCLQKISFSARQSQPADQIKCQLCVAKSLLYSLETETFTLLKSCETNFSLVGTFFVCSCCCLSGVRLSLWALCSEPLLGSETSEVCHCTVKHHTDIINFACMTWNFVRISASLSALCTNFYFYLHFLQNSTPF